MVTIVTSHDEWRASNFSASYNPSTKPSLGTAFSPDGTERFLRFISVPISQFFGIQLDIESTAIVESGTRKDLSTAFEQEGQITISIGGESVTVVGTGSDTTDPYNWTPPNVDDVRDIGSAILASSNRIVTLEFSLASLTIAPIATQTATLGTAYSQTLPAATQGDGDITYTITADNFRGLTADTSTRIISGTPTSSGQIVVTYTATDSATTPETTSQTFIINVNAAPTYADDTGDAQTWVTGSVISPLPVPEANGWPTPTYVISNLPTGLSYSEDTRLITGAPTSTGSGTIRARATNSQGMDDWTVAYSITNPANIAPSFEDTSGANQMWTANIAITNITVPLASGFPIPTYSVVGMLPTGIAFATNTRVISGTPTTAGMGIIIIRATNTQGTADWSINYDIAAALTTPSFASNTGNAQTWTVNRPIANIVVPVASGNPTPTYSVVGSVLPSGLSFNAGTRTISGTPNTVDTGTIRIRATNSQGTDDWSFTYAVSAALQAPAFANDSGTPRTWTLNQPITPLIVPAANGNPTPTYARVGALPRGLTFNTNTRQISGTPNEAGSGTIRIRATNSQGTDDWTLDYSVIAASTTSINFELVNTLEEVTGSLVLPARTAKVEFFVRVEGTNNNADLLGAVTQPRLELGSTRVVSKQRGRAAFSVVRT